MKKIKIFVLNLKKDRNRRRHIVSELKKQNIKDYEIIEAIDGNKLAKKKLYTIICKDKKIFNPTNTNMSNAEVACALSHVKIYKKFLKSKFELALIFEDDSVFLENFTEKLKKFILKNFRYKSQIILLSKLIQFYKKPIDEIKSHEFVEVTKASQTHSYFINRKAAQSIISFNYPVKTLADNFLVFRAYCGIKIFGLNPYITTQDMKKFKSNLPSKFDLYKIFKWKIYLADKKNKILKSWFKKLISHYY